VTVALVPFFTKVTQVRQCCNSVFDNNEDFTHKNYKSSSALFSLDICFASHENLASLTANPARPDVCIFRGERSTVQGHGHLKFCLHTKRLDQLATM
jgi:hypothetical protein